MAWLARKHTRLFSLPLVVNNYTYESVPIWDGKIEVPRLL
jgi:hypothetical protein